MLWERSRRRDGARLLQARSATRSRLLERIPDWTVEHGGFAPTRARLREDYQAIAGRNRGEYEIAYLFVDDITERLRPRRQA